MNHEFCEETIKIAGNIREMTKPTSRELANYHSLHVEVEKEANDELLRHLQGTVLGTPGGLQYQHTTVGQKLSHIRNIYFMLLKKSGHLLGSVGLIARRTLSGSKDYKSWYVRYFSIRAPLRSKKYNPETAKKEASRSVGLLKSVAGHYFENPGLLQSADERTGEPSFLYAYIEDENFRSMRFSRDMGMQPCRQFTTVLFSRIKLRTNDKVQKAGQAMYAEILEKLKSFYSGHTMFNTDNLFLGGNYLVYMEDGRMKAGLQVHPDKWKIVARAGFTGKLLLKVFPRIPGIKKFFDPANFRFLAVEGIWFEAGYENQLETLLQSACAQYHTHLVMMWFDTQCPVLKTINLHVDNGLFGKMIKQTEAEIMVRFYGFTEEMIGTFRERPAYLSAYDMI